MLLREGTLTVENNLAKIFQERGGRVIILLKRDTGETGCLGDNPALLAGNMDTLLLRHSPGERED